MNSLHDASLENSASNDTSALPEKNKLRDPKRVSPESTGPADELSDIPRLHLISDEPCAAGACGHDLEDGSLPYREFLARIRRFFDGPSEHLDLIADALARGRLQQPVKPMSDQELAQAIREFLSAPASPNAIEKLEAKLSTDKE
ncbi:hypothetical protein ACTZWT_03385 [Rhodopseudomonas sp. NSM]|uniref:hypothetical protein n=1 Tax=Rhodopseudomonas sp. NSM TaxID=3457630 RepID=UPI0040359156